MRYWILLIGYAFLQTIEAQRVKWVLSPSLDSLKADYVENASFIFSAGGKKGFYLTLRGVEVPALFDSIGLQYAIMHDYETSASNGPHFYPVRTGRKWGLYAAESQELMLPCIYDSLPLYEENYRVFKGSLCGLFNPRENKWLSPMEKDCPTYPLVKAPYDKRGNAYLGDETRIISEEGGPAMTSAKTRITKLADSLFGRHLSYYPQPLSDNLYIISQGVLRISPPAIVVPQNEAYKSFQLQGRFLIARTSMGQVAIDSSNGKVLTPVFEWLRKVNTMAKASSLISAQVQGKKGLFSQNYETLIPFEFDDIAYNESPDLAFCFRDTNKIRIFNLATNKFIENNFDTIIYKGMGVAMLVRKKKQFYRYDLKTDQMKKLTFEHIKACLPSDSVFVVAQQKGKAQLFNLNQNRYLSRIHEDIGFMTKTVMFNHFERDLYQQAMQLTKQSERALLVYKENSKSGLMDRNGKIVIEAIYDSMYAFGEVDRETLEKNIMSLFKQGKQDVIILKKGSYLSLFNPLSRKFELDSMTAFKPVKRDEYSAPEYWYVKNGKWGFVNRKENLYLPPAYDSFYLRDYFYVLKEQGKYRVMKVRRRIILEPETYDSVIALPHEKRLHIVSIGQLYGLINAEGKKIVDCRFDTVFMDPLHVDNLNVVVLKKDGKIDFWLSHRDYVATEAQDYRFGHNGLLWARVNGKWGVLRIW